jgi:hypothetical protein
MYSELVGHMAHASEDYAETINLTLAENDSKQASLYHRRAVGGLMIALSYMLNSRPILELEYLTSVRPEDMDAGGGWWVMLMGECAGVLLRHTAGHDVFRLRQDGTHNGDFISPMSRWFRRHVEPEDTPLAGPALGESAPPGVDTIVGYVGTSGEIVNSLFEAWSFSEVVRRGLEAVPESDSSFNHRMNDAAEKLRGTLSSEGFWGSRTALVATWLSRSINIGTAGYKLYTGTMDYSSFASALGTGADIWAARAGEQSVAAARCLMLKTALAAIEFGRSASTSRDAAIVGDTSVAVGAGMVAAASGLTVAWTIVAGAAPTGPVGWCIGAVALTGGLVVTLTTDDDIEIYGRYSLYSRDRLTEWPTAFVGNPPYLYIRSDSTRWGDDDADGYQANLRGLLCYIYKVHGVSVARDDSSGKDKVTIELHSSPAPTTIRMKAYFRSGGFGAISAAVGAGTFKVIEVTCSRMAGRRGHAHIERHELNTDPPVCRISSDSSKWEVEVELKLSADDRENWVLYDAYVQVMPFGTDEFVTPANGWWKSGGYASTLP